jgi:hypothetical protein
MLTVLTQTVSGSRHWALKSLSCAVLRWANAATISKYERGSSITVLVTGGGRPGRSSGLTWPTMPDRVASGGSFAVRQLYTDADEVLFQAARPTILNGIEDVITRQDLADRANISYHAIPFRRSSTPRSRTLARVRATSATHLGCFA